jgi:hypothetical protein
MLHTVVLLVSSGTAAALALLPVARYVAGVPDIGSQTQYMPSVTCCMVLAGVQGRVYTSAGHSGNQSFISGHSS